MTLREDAYHLKRGQSPCALAVINDLAISLALRSEWTNLAEARRYFDANLDQAQKIILHQLTDY